MSIAHYVPEEKATPTAEDKLLRKWYGDTEGPLGLPMKSAVASAVEQVIAGLNADCRRLIEHGICRVTKTPAAFDLDAGSRTDVSLITTDSVDRDSEVILADGLDFSQFKKAGMPVTFAHNYNQLPVGRGLWIKRHSENGVKGWAAKTYYAERPKDWEGAWFPDGVWHLIQNDMLRGKSIGFIPTEIHTPTPDEIKKRPELASVRSIFDKVLVLEYAVAPVQSNPDALVQQVAKAREGGVVISDAVLDACGVILPTVIPVLKIPEPEATSSTRFPLSGMADSSQMPPALTRNEVRKTLEDTLRKELAQLPTLFRDALDVARGRV